MAADDSCSYRCWPGCCRAVGLLKTALILMIPFVGGCVLTALGRRLRGWRRATVHLSAPCSHEFYASAACRAARSSIWRRPQLRSAAAAQGRGKCWRGSSSADSAAAILISHIPSCSGPAVVSWWRGRQRICRRRSSCSCSQLLLCVRPAAAAASAAAAGCASIATFTRDARQRCQPWRVPRCADNSAH